MVTMYDIFKKYRVKDWLHYLGYVVFGFVITKEFNVFIFLTAICLLSFAYSFNDYFDENLKDRIFIYPIIIFIIFLPFLSFFQIFFSFIFILIFAMYSWPKIYLEGKPIFSLISNSLGFLILFLLSLSKLELVYKFLELSILIFCLNSIAQIIHEIVHYKKDKNVNKKTTVVCIGIKKSIFLLRVVIIFTLIFSLFLFQKFKFISLSTSTFLIYFFLTSFFEKINSSFRNKFKFMGILCGGIYIIEFVKVI